MKIIFLDIDGVLNWTDTTDRVDGFIGLDPEHIARFNRIIEAHPDAKIVISSSWRHCSPLHVQAAYHDFNGLVKLLQTRGLKGTIIDHTPIFFGNRGRGHEIREWLDPTGIKFGVTQYVILDDDLTGMEPYVPVRTKWDDDDVEWADTMSKVEVDLRPHHVVTAWDGYAPEPPSALWTQGGLQDRHIDQAIRVLNGELIPTPPVGEAYKDPTWE